MRLSALQVRSVVAADFQVTCAPTQIHAKHTAGSVPGQVELGIGWFLPGPADAIAEGEKEQEKKTTTTGDAKNRQGPRQIIQWPGDWLMTGDAERRGPWLWVPVWISVEIEGD